MDYDIIAEITFFLENDGGRKSPTPGNFFGCPIVIDGKFYDCRLLLNEIGSVAPGDTVIVPIKFLDSATVFKLIKQGDSFELWEQRIIGKGIVTDIKKINTMFN